MNSVNWLPVAVGNATVFTAVDRAVYVQVTVPKSYSQPPLAPISDAVAQALPPICHFPADEIATPTPTQTTSAVRPPIGGQTSAPVPTGPVGPLCTRRS